jgi:hypothetical protein
VADSAYATEEYQSKRGWGHGTFDICMVMAVKADVKTLGFTHHEPLRSDDDLDRIFRSLKECPQQGTPVLNT